MAKNRHVWREEYLRCKAARNMSNQPDDPLYLKTLTWMCLGRSHLAHWRVSFGPPETGYLLLEAAVPLAGLGFYSALAHVPVAAGAEQSADHEGADHEG